MRHPLLLLFACFFACTRPGPTPEAPRPAESKKPAVSQNALTDAAGTELVPREALFVATTGPIGRTLERLGYGAFTKALGAIYLEAAAEITRDVGRNLLDPKAWGEMGVDLDGPLGFAWLDAPGETAMFFATLRDAKAFEAAVIAMGARAKDVFVRAPHGEALMLHPKSTREVNFVIRGRRVAFVFSDDGAETGLRWANRIATLKPTESMGADAKVKAELAAVGGGVDLGAILNTRALVDAIVADISRDRSAEWDQRRLERAREQGDQAAIAAAEARIRERRLRDPLAPAKHKAKGVLVRGFLAGIGDLALGLDVEGPTLRLRARLPLTAESLPRAVFSGGEGALRLPLAYSARPTLLSTGRVNVKAAIERLRAIVTAAGDGDDLEELDRTAREVLGAGLADLPTVLTGELGAAVTLTPVESRRFLGFFEGVRGAGALGLKDTKRAREALGKGAARAGVPLDPSGRLQVPIGRGHVLTAGVTGDYLAAASDESVYARIGTGDASASFVNGLKNAALKALFSRPDPAQLWAFDPGIVAVFGAGKKHQVEAVALQKASGLTAARVDLDGKALRIDGGQFCGAASVPDAFAALGRFISAVERW